MGIAEPARRIGPDERVEGHATPGMTREEAIAVDGMWSGFVRTAGGAASGWHHHGDYDTTIFVVSGSLRMESGPGGSSVVDAAPGDFIFVPKGSVHREANPGDDESHLVVVRAGTGPAVVNVDGPAPADGRG